tara:strand:+ start:1411 stop:2451 length:1041 start_codon:yes stop_codon:yes gene_type:complete
LYHVRVDLWVGWWKIVHFPNEYSSIERAAAWISIPTPFLGYSILLFFLISGFCIHYPNTLHNARPNWKNYFKRRFWRIYPTYFFAVFLTIFISYYCHIQWEDNTWSTEKIIRILTLSQNYPPGNGQFLSNPSLWTIPLEIEFYFLYPLAFLLISRYGFYWILILSIFLSGIAIHLTKEGIQWVSFTSLFLWPSWLLGSWVATLHRENKLSKLKFFTIYPTTFLFLILALISRLHHWESWIQYVSWLAFYFCFFILFLRSKKILKLEGMAILRFLAWIGKISFSLYLIHFPLFKLLGYIHCEYFGEKPANFLFSLFYLAPVIVMAWLFYKYVENPIHKWSKKHKVTE